ncbi:MAG: hypothetical protein DRR19_09175 [Candidatus Parabeggiatoa sp. nov. 1]|nr:MAG: hypothetical protein DRR19_09175 [Gammaproteobacteria bacterium]
MDNQINQIFNAATNLALGKMTETVLEIVEDKKLLVKLEDRNLSLQELSELWDMPFMTTRTIAQCLCGVGILSYQEEKISVSEQAYQFLQSYKLVRDVALKGSPYIESPVLIKKRLLEPIPQSWYVMRDQKKNPEETNLARDFYSSMHQLRVKWGIELAEQYDFSENNGYWRSYRRMVYWHQKTEPSPELHYL